MAILYKFSFKCTLDMNCFYSSLYGIPCVIATLVLESYGDIITLSLVLVHEHLVSIATQWLITVIMQ